MHCLNIDGVIEESVKGNHHNQMVWFCYELYHIDIIWKTILAGCMNNILIVSYSIICASKKVRFIMICCLNVDGVIGESVLVNHHYEMVWFCYEMT